MKGEILISLLDPCNEPAIAVARGGPQHEIDGCFDDDDPTQAAIEIILRLDGAQAAGGTEQRESELSALKTSCVALQRYALRLVLPWQLRSVG